VADVVLGIETSCDETSAAILVGETDHPRLASLVILTQDIHRVFGGVVPELASRAHLRAIDPVIQSAVSEAGTTFGAIDAIAVTAGPGLVGALLVGVSFAKGLGMALNRPVLGVHHLEGHLFAPTLEQDVQPPFVALLVSGGHTALLDVPEWGTYRLLGQTRDDAAGEAFDKVATLLGLAYPGGPAIEALAQRGTDRFAFPRPMLGDGLDLSFSGLKTAVRHAVKASADLDADRADLAASFQAAVVDVLTAKAVAALDCTGRDTVVLGGGVACNALLTRCMIDTLGDRARVVTASPRLNVDNAGMIARAGWFHLRRGATPDPNLDADPSLPWPGLVRDHSPTTPARH